MIGVDIITVFHNETNYEQHLELFDAIKKHEPNGGYRLIAIDNRVNNRGFAKACNLGAFHPGVDAPIIGFINPDAKVHGPFINAASAALDDLTVITGARFPKPARQLQEWGIRNFVCGAAMFVQRRWFAAVNGFDEQFVWTWEEIDLIRRAESQGLRCDPIYLPIEHDSPTTVSAADRRYKQTYNDLGAKRFYIKWGSR